MIHLVGVADCTARRLDQHHVSFGRLYQAAVRCAKNILQCRLVGLCAEHQYVVLPCCHEGRQYLLGRTIEYLDAFAAHMKFTHQLCELHRPLHAQSIVILLALAVEDVEIAVASQSHETRRVEDAAGGVGGLIVETSTAP